MKTPEEMAEEYCEDHDECEFAREAFLAGYQAAKDTYKDAISAYEDVAKQMLEEAVRIMSPKDQLADADKVMCNTKMEEIKAVDTGELMPMTNLPTLAKWISVKDRLPEIGEHGYSEDVLLLSEVGRMEVSHIEKVKRVVKWRGIEPVIETESGTPIEYFTHWMPLPEAPKGEG